MEQKTPISPEELYELLLSTATDSRKLWMLDSDDGYVVIQIPDGTVLPIWHDETSALAFASEGQTPVSSDLNAFFSLCAQIYNDIIGFAVSPSKDGLALVAADSLLNDLEDRLGIAP